MSRTVIVGASAGVGRSIAERLAEDRHELFLIATDIADLTPQQKDLQLRFRTRVAVMAVDLRSFDATALRNEVFGQLGGIDNVVVVAGASDPQVDSGPIDPGFVRDLIEVNFLGAVDIVNAFLPDLATAPQGNLVGIGSVAGVRGRSNNMVYGAAKRGLETYFEACRHWLARQGGACVQFYRLGFVATSMTFGQSTPLPAASPEAIAERIAKNLGKDIGMCYLPNWWALVMTVLQFVPWFVFKRLNI